MKFSSMAILAALVLALFAAPAHAGGPIALEITAQPTTVPAGGATIVTVIARSPESGTLVADAEVSLRASGGYFGMTARASRGTTDERGVFRTVWRTEGAERYTRDTSYVILAEVTHPGHEAGTGSLALKVTIQETPAPAPTVVTPLVLSVEARPQEVPAGGETELTAHVSDEDGEPVAGAVVRAAVGGGSFVGAKGPLVEGRTDASGAWRARWRTEDRTAYAASTSYVFLLEATKKGYRSAVAQKEVMVYVREAAPPARPRAMVVQATAHPAQLVGGGTATIRVTARSASGEPVTGALVRVSATAGMFLDSRETTATGATDGAGTFVVAWSTRDGSPPRAETGFEFRVVVEKDGYRPGSATAFLAARPAREVAPASPRRIRVVAAARPDEIPPTGFTVVAVRAVTEEGGPLAGASVRVQSGGGRFDGGGGTSARGTTDDQGTFRVVWRPGDPRLYTQTLDAVFSVRVVSPGHVTGVADASVRVFVAERPPPTPPVRPTMEVRVTTHPTEVDAGGVATITVAARDSRGGPLVGASVTLRADGGVFRRVTGLSATGVTDGSGVFRIQWRTNNAPTYTATGRHTFRAEVAQAGYPTGSSTSSVGVRPFRVR